MGAKSDHFCLFSAYFGVFSPDLLMEYKIFILAVDISKNLKNIDIDKAILKYIDINIDKIREWYSEVWKIMSPRINTLMFTNFQNIVIFLKNNVKKFPDFFIFNHLQSRILYISYIPLTPEQSLHQYHNIPCNFKPLSACYSKSLLIFPTYAFFYHIRRCNDCFTGLSCIYITEIRRFTSKLSDFEKINITSINFKLM